MAPPLAKPAFNLFRNSQLWKINATIPIALSDQYLVVPTGTSCAPEGSRSTRPVSQAPQSGQGRQKAYLLACRKALVASRVTNAKITQTLILLKLYALFTHTKLHRVKSEGVKKLVKWLEEPGFLVSEHWWTTLCDWQLSSYASIDRPLRSGHIFKYHP